MPAFPILKTGAVAQYPLEQKIRFQTEAVKFMDGSQQKYRIYGAGLRVWTVKLDLLDDREVARLIAFIEQQGSAAFAFLDPISGQSVPRCVISGDRFEVTAAGESNGAVQVLIEEIV